MRRGAEWSGRLDENVVHAGGFDRVKAAVEPAGVNYVFVEAK